MDAHQEALQKWEPIILAVAESNQSARLWCREHNISVDQFYYWRKKLGLNQQDRKGCGRDQVGLSAKPGNYRKSFVPATGND